MQAQANVTGFGVRLTRLVVLAVLVVTVLYYFAAHVLAWRWIQEPFLGMFLEPTLVISSMAGKGWARLELDPPLELPDRLVALDGQPVQRRADVTTVLLEHSVGDTVWVMVERPDGSLREERIALTTFRLGDFISFFLVPFLTGLAYLGIGIWVYWVQGWGRAGQVFVLVCTCFAVILAGLFDANTTHRLTFLWVAAFPLGSAALLHLALVFPQETRFIERFPLLRFLPYIPALFLIYRAERTLFDVAHPWAYIGCWLNHYLFAVVSILCLLGMLVHRLVRPPSPLLRQQSRIILLGASLTFLPVIPWLGASALGVGFPFQPLLYVPFFVFFPLAIAYAILRYRLLDVDRLLSQGLAYGGLTFIIVAAYFSIINGLSHILSVSVRANDPVILTLFVLALVFLFNPLRAWIQRAVDRVFFREPVDYRAALQDFSRQLTTSLELETVLDALAERIESTLHPGRLWAFLYDEDTDRYVGGTVGRDAPRLPPVVMSPGGPLVRWLQRHQECLYLPSERALPRELAGERVQMSALGAVIYVGLRTRKRLTGWLALGPKRFGQPYRSDDLAFLSALADQSTLAVENARLFASVRRNLAAITEMKNLMDDVFASIASGVITTDVQDKITLFNRAAESILGVPAVQVQGHPYREALPALGHEIHGLVDMVKRREVPVTAYELQPELPTRGPVWLRMNFSPLKDSRNVTTGVTMVVDDLTERRELEARMRYIRQTFQRYVAPAVVERLLSDPERVKLGGVRQEVTSFYADIRAFTAFSEKVPPEFQIEVLNHHLTLASGAVLAHEGTLDKFVGDSVMAIFNAPLPQEDHVLRAVRAALALQEAIADHHARVPEGERLSFGVGVTVGEAVVGNIGSTVQQNFSAIGDCVNFSSRLSNLAGPGQILISAEAYERVKDHVEANFIGHVQVKGHSEPDPVYEVLGLKPVGW